MITKQQALEFIYDLSQKTEIMLDVSCGEMQFNRIVDGDYLYTSFAGESTLEATVTKCIKEHMDAIMNYVDKIPVDVDMLEVGQIYEIEYDNYGEIDRIVDKLTKITIDEHRNNCRTLHFDRHCSITEGLILEIYKVNEHANMS